MTTTRRRAVVERLVRGPAGFRALLERSGPTFIKLGQFLALRPDIVPQEYCDELIYLLDRVPPFPWAQVRATLKADFGAEPEELFAYINPRPVAAGSFAQTHVARLPGGAEVAVKVQRPGIVARVERDLRRMRQIAVLLRVAGVPLAVSPKEVVEELAVWLREETDLLHELVNLERLHALARESRTEHIPRPCPQLCSTRVLTAEFLNGVPFTELLSGPGLRPFPGEERQDRARVARNLVAATFRQMFRYGFYHADLHPGNLLLLPGGVIGYVDFGLCAILDEQVRRDQLRYLSAVYRQDVEAMFRALRELLVPGERADVEGLRMDFLRETRDFLGRLPPGGRAPAGARTRSPIAQWLVAVMRAARRHHFRVPTNILSMYRALLTAETVASRLSDSVSLRSVGRRFFRELQVEQVLDSLQPERMQPVLLDTLTLARDAPGQLREILADVSEGRFVLRVAVAEEVRTRRARDHRTRLLAASLLSLGVALLLLAPAPPRLLGVPLRAVLTAALGASWLLTWVYWRRLR